MKRKSQPKAKIPVLSNLDCQSFGSSNNNIIIFLPMFLQSKARIPPTPRHEYKQRGSFLLQNKKKYEDKRIVKYIVILITSCTKAAAICSWLFWQPRVIQGQQAPSYHRQTWRFSPQSEATALPHTEDALACHEDTLAEPSQLAQERCDEGV